MLTVILTGGSSRRMGSDKAALMIDGQTMSALLIERYQCLGPVAVAVNEKGRFPCEGAIELVDEYPGHGPLNGIVSAFYQTGAEMIFLTATDLPRGDPELVRRLAGLIGGCDACVIRREDGNLEPLFALYRKACRPAAKESIEKGRRSIHAMLKHVNVRYAGERELKDWDLDEVLLNVNTPEDYIKLKGMRS